MRSIIQQLGANDFPRIRLGIDRPAGQMPVEAYVLQKFSVDEWQAMTITYSRAVEAVGAVVSQGINIAMNLFNVEAS